MKRGKAVLGILFSAAALLLLSACGKKPPSAALHQAQTDPVSIAIGDICDKLGNSVSLDALNAQERVLFLSVELDAEVCNGGFSQLYCNYSGDYANEIPQAFEELNAPEIAEICRKANALFGEKVPEDHEERYRIFRELPEEPTIKLMDACDQEYYEKRTVLHELQLAYIETNAKYFGK